MRTLSEVRDLSFPDMDVLGTRYEAALKTLTVTMSGAWLDHELPKGDLEIRDWTTLHQRRFLPDLKTWAAIDVDNLEPFKDLPEMEVNEDRILLRGFGVNSGQWLELEAIGARATYQYG